MSAYRPPTFGPEIDLDLSRNEGAPLLSSIPFDGAEVEKLTSRYPDTGRLAEVVAAHHGLPVEQVLITAGGDDALFRCFLSASGGSIVATTPSFEMIRRYSEQLGLSLKEVEWWDGQFPVDEFLERRDAGGPASESDVAVVVSPNNPTGNVVGPGELRKVADAYPLVILDAAYCEFADEDLTPAALEMGNVVIIRTLSKAFGLAGLRVGYLLGPAGVVERLRGFGSPYSVSAVSAALAVSVLEGSEPDVAPIRLGRARTTKVLQDLGVDVLTSQANFVLATGVDDVWLVEAAAALGVALRRFPDRPELAGSVRITVPGDSEDLDRLERTLQTALAPQAMLFDMDGVLADVRESFRAAIVATASGFGLEVTPGQISSAKALGNASDDWEVTHRLLLAGGVEVTYPEVVRVFESHYQGGLKERETLLADRDWLRELAERLPLGVVTARPRKDAVEFLERFSIDDCFGAVVTREDAAPKPDPEPVQAALELLGVERAWMCGDTRDDITSARGAGVVPIGIAVPGDDQSGLAGAARILASVNQLQEVLDVTNI